MDKDLYADLGLKPDATKEDIKKAYRAAAKEHHPDRGGKAEAFHRVTHAGQILIDPRRREAYDRTGDADARVPDPEIVGAQTIVQLFDKLLAKYKDEIIYVDVVIEMKETLRTSTKTSFNNRREAHKTIEFLKTLKNRVDCKVEHNLLSNHVDKIIQSNHITIQQAETDIKILIAARRLLRKYDFRKEIRTLGFLEYGTVTTVSQSF